MTAFGPWTLESDGPLARDYTKIPYTRVQRPIWPLDREATPRLLL